MNKEEVKQYLKIQIDSSVKMQIDDNRYYLCYNKNYLRALKLSKITGTPVNKENFTGGEKLFRINTTTKTFIYFNEISDYLDEIYSNDYLERVKICEEVFHEYDEYKGYKHW